MEMVADNGIDRWKCLTTADAVGVRALHDIVLCCSSGLIVYDGECFLWFQI